MDFSGLKVIAFESRQAESMRQLLIRFGAKPLVAPSMQEIPLSDQTAIWDFGRRLMESTLDILILLTGVGTRFMMKTLESRYPKEALVQAMRRLTLVARGPKPIIALREIDLSPTITVPEPNTWRDILNTLDTQCPVKNKRLAVQEYGNSNPALLEALRQRGAAEVLVVGVYRWALPDDIKPLQEAIESVCEGRADVLLFTSAHQIENVLEVARQMGREEAFRLGVRRCVMASVGPVCSASLRDLGFAVDIEPPHPKTGSLLSVASQKSVELLQQKRKSP
ncbi:MAG: uroporphyrinogen-III synthase [Candidatus Omnitrophica bacterium]|nr:uroporphyrinogen-III synthase [Candidatus Omnitrophota bacterium]